MSWVEILFSSGFAVSLLMWLLDRKKRASEIEKIKSEIIDTDVARAHESAEEWKNLAQNRDEDKKLLNAKIDTLYLEKAQDREQINTLIKENTQVEIENAQLKAAICRRFKCLDRDPPFLNTINNEKNSNFNVSNLTNGLRKDSLRPSRAHENYYRNSPRHGDSNEAGERDSQTDSQGYDQQG